MWRSVGRATGVPRPAKPARQTGYARDLFVAGGAGAGHRLERPAMMVRYVALTLALAGLTACEPPEGPNTTKAPGAPAAGTNAPAAAPAAPAAQGGTAPAGATRTLSDTGRAAMKDHLVVETTGKKAWILSQPGDAEVQALVGNLVSVFKEVGWEVQAETVSGISLKPGVMTLVGEEQYPSYVDTVLKALDATGLGAKSASGYRGYYESKKQENPNWPGVPMRKDQDFVIVVGPRPTA